MIFRFYRLVIMFESSNVNVDVPCGLLAWCKPRKLFDERKSINFKNMDVAIAQDKCKKLIKELLKTSRQDLISSHKNTSEIRFFESGSKSSESLLTLEIIFSTILKRLESGSSTSTCLLTIEIIFTELLKRKLETESMKSACLQTVEMIFSEILEKRDIFEETIKTKPSDKNDTEHIFEEWHRKTKEEIWNSILLCIEQGKPQALSVAMNLLAWEGKYQTDCFPEKKFRAILVKILSNKVSMSNLLKTFGEFSAYVDVVYYTWRHLLPLLPKTQPNEIYIKNVLDVIDKIPIPKANIDDPSAILCHRDEKPAFIFNDNSVKKWINKVWNSIMQWEFTPVIHKQLLIVLIERILPHLDKPTLLTDFLMDSLDMGGPVSLLALQGIYTMIAVHNLDYPNIYGKLYSMFEPEIFHSKFKPRLFYLSDLFLSSIYLPESLVAAFAKRLARLSLVAPPEDILIICLFIGNLILRHPGLKKMINHPNGGQVSSDPYIMEERDPYKSNAFESSLWEIQTLQSHVIPSVATAARFINQPLPSVEWDMGRILENTSDDIFDKEIKKIPKEMILSFNKPQSIALPRGEKVMQYWQLTS